MRRVGICLLWVVSAAARDAALRDYGRLPLVFEPNQGQADPAVKFLARTGGGTLVLTEREAVLESLRVDGDGDLVLKTAAGELRQKRPSAYQDTAAGRVAVEVGYRLKAGRRVGFELARYDAGRRLVIDPVLLYSTYLGGSDNDGG